MKSETDREIIDRTEYEQIENKKFVVQKFGKVTVRDGKAFYQEGVIRIEI